MYHLFIWRNGEWDHFGSSQSKEAAGVMQLIAWLNGDDLEVIGW